MGERIRAQRGKLDDGLGRRCSNRRVDCCVRPLRLRRAHPAGPYIGCAVTVDPLTISERQRKRACFNDWASHAIWTDERVFAYIWEHANLAVLVVLVAPGASSAPERDR